MLAFTFFDIPFLADDEVHGSISVTFDTGGSIKAYSIGRFYVDNSVAIGGVSAPGSPSVAARVGIQSYGAFVDDSIAAQVSENVKGPYDTPNVVRVTTRGRYLHDTTVSFRLSDTTAAVLLVRSAGRYLTDDNGDVQAVYMGYRPVTSGETFVFGYRDGPLPEPGTEDLSRTSYATAGKHLVFLKGFGGGDLDDGTVDVARSLHVTFGKHFQQPGFAFGGVGSDDGLGAPGIDLSTFGRFIPSHDVFVSESIYDLGKGRGPNFFVSGTSGLYKPYLEFATVGDSCGWSVSFYGSHSEQPATAGQDSMILAPVQTSGQDKEVDAAAEVDYNGVRLVTYGDFLDGRHNTLTEDQSTVVTLGTRGFARLTAGGILQEDESLILLETDDADEPYALLKE